MLLSPRQEPSGPRKGGRRALPLPQFAVGQWALPILEEVHGEFGGELFQRATDLGLWASLDGADLAGLFHHSVYRLATGAPPELEPSLAVLARVVNRPGEVRGVDLSRACMTTREWAEKADFPETALIFAELAAVTDPGNAETALQTAKAFRQAARFGTARRWFEHTVATAHRAGDHRTRIEAYLGAGILEERTGAHRRAHALFRKAHRAAKRHDLRELGAAAHLNAMALAVQSGRFSTALMHAEAATVLYGPKHEIIPTLAQDVAQMWSLQGIFDLALDLFRAALPQIKSESQRFITTANVIRAAAGAGDREAFVTAWGELDRMHVRENEFTAEALVGIGEGALMLGLYSHAREMGEAALAIARRRGELFTITEAEDLLRRVPHRLPSVVPVVASDREKAFTTRLLRILETAAPR